MQQYFATKRTTTCDRSGGAGTNGARAGAGGWLESMGRPGRQWGVEATGRGGRPPGSALDELYYSYPDKQLTRGYGTCKCKSVVRGEMKAEKHCNFMIK